MTYTARCDPPHSAAQLKSETVSYLCLWFNRIDADFIGVFPV
jgi:hypothetical protein